MTSIRRLPYIRGMQLGSAFDVSKSKVGSNIFHANVSKLSSIRRYRVSQSRYGHFIDGFSDAVSYLRLPYHICLQIMAGSLDVGGIGHFLKSTYNSDKVVRLWTSSFVKLVSRVIQKN